LVKRNNTSPPATRVRLTHHLVAFPHSMVHAGTNVFNSFTLSSRRTKGHPLYFH